MAPTPSNGGRARSHDGRPVVGRRSSVVGRRSPVVGRRSSVAGRRSPVVGRAHVCGRVVRLSRPSATNQTRPSKTQDMTRFFSRTRHSLRRSAITSSFGSGAPSPPAIAPCHRHLPSPAVVRSHRAVTSVGGGARVASSSSCSLPPLSVESAFCFLFRRHALQRSRVTTDRFSDVFHSFCISLVLLNGTHLFSQRTPRRGLTS